MINNEIEVNEEMMKGKPEKIEIYVKKEIISQIESLDITNYEDICENMRLYADIIEIIEENKNEKEITLKYNPMGAWYLEEKEGF